MENILDEKEPDAIHLTDQEIFANIWTSPRLVFKFINDNNYDKHVTVLLILGGISSALDRAVLKDFGDQMPLIALLALCVVLGGMFGWLSYYIYAAMISWTGGWLGGLGKTSAILRVLAYAALPSIIALGFLIPQMVVYGSGIFKAEGDIVSAGWVSNIVVYGSMLLEFVMGILAIILAVVGISEVQKFSIGKAVLNSLLPLFIIFIPIVTIILLFELF
jgi:hypothetical protein